MLNRYKLILFPLIVIIFAGFVRSDNDIYYQMSKSIDIFGRVYKEVTLNYVDKVDPEEFMLAGIKGMLESLDPYTTYIGAEQQGDIDVITKGKYGGIGATIGLRNQKVTIVDLIEGYSAQRQGMRIGDVIKEIDDVEINKHNYDDLGSFLKGEPGSIVKVVIAREGEEQDIIFNLIREEIELKNLTYYGFVPENSGNAYLKLSGFSRTAGDEIKDALLELKKENEIESIVFDLRGNPGGLLDAAIDVSEKFLERNHLVVSVIGKDTVTAKEYFSSEEPVSGTTKLVVLVDEGSASASEIVAGAIQDHDRGIILGQVSFGKGLVQTLLPLSYETSLKITTARYYTPSGRCIQKINYSENNDVVEYESQKLAEFLTDNNRKVYAGGGITPDTLVSNMSDSYQVKNLLAKGMFFKFATMFYNADSDISLDSIDEEELFNQFLEFLKSEDFEFVSKSKRLLNELKAAIKEEEFNGEILSTVTNLDERIIEIETEELINYKLEIISNIKEELASRIKGRSARIIESLKSDNQFETALELLADSKVYESLLK
ncbi:MAG: S41 family peptidase [Melioribacteraceae bacterium]|nr:S41 family peptidase [Melioribacteraceae bacterium]MCF8355273.1 S41 family peptidase [Melioribacteraceae bacterium]MCF8394172.1 S41 family peptidase [Melioribacteraceae bacterium]MCF8418855.1 S41 family peptidase [Melioribacteraceae bacterium]